MMDDELVVLGLPQYLKALRRYRKLEPRLDHAVIETLAKELEGGDLDEIQGTGGWVKGRVASPIRGLGKQGGFRVIYLCLRVQQDIYLQTVYDHRQVADLLPDEKRLLKKWADQLKRSSPEEP